MELPYKSGSLRNGRGLTSLATGGSLRLFLPTSSQTLNLDIVATSDQTSGLITVSVLLWSRGRIFQKRTPCVG